MSGVEAVFFDLDDTLIGFPNGVDGLVRDLYADAVGDAGTEEERERFVRAFWDSTLGLWAAMHNGRLSGDQVRRRRIAQALAALGIHDEAMADWLLTRWDDRNVAAAALKPGAHTVLDAVARRYYLGLITDGFRTIQRAKLRAFDLEHHFQSVHISEEAGVSKPFAGAFHKALCRAGVEPEAAVMVGDNPNADICGALGVGMCAIHLADGDAAPETPSGALRAHSLDEVASLLSL